MANPQIENGHVDLANEIVEALARVRISGVEMQCLWVVLRKTYGWHKKEDSISISQFMQATGLKRPHVCRALRSLVSKMVLGSTNNGTSITSYRFNKDFEKWVLVSKKVLSPNNGTRASTKNGNGVVPILVHTKENIQKKSKERRQRKSLLPDEEFWNEVKKIYWYIDMEREIQKMKGYQLTPRGRSWKMTQRRVIEWLNRIDKPIEAKTKDEW